MGLASSSSKPKVPVPVSAPLYRLSSMGALSWDNNWSSAASIVVRFMLLVGKELDFIRVG